MRPTFPTLALASALLAGCGGGESNNPDVKTAEQAVGIPTETKDGTRTVETTRKVTVIKDTKVIDNETGKMLSEKVEKTPVTITREKSEKTDVNVNVGDTTATVNGQTKVEKK